MKKIFVIVNRTMAFYRNTDLISSVFELFAEFFTRSSISLTQRLNNINIELISINVLKTLAACFLSARLKISSITLWIEETLSSPLSLIPSDFHLWFIRLLFRYMLRFSLLYNSVEKSEITGVYFFHEVIVGVWVIKSNRRLRWNIFALTSLLFLVFDRGKNTTEYLFRKEYLISIWYFPS